MNAILRTALSIYLIAGLLIGAGPLLTVTPLAESFDHTSSQSETVIFFAADGLRQDLVEEYTSHGLLPALRVLMQQGAQAADDGLLTQAPPNTGAGWYSLATGAWPGVHGSTNNTFHVNGQPFANRTTAFTPGVLQAETIAQAAERGGKKVAQIEWAGGRIGTISGPTVDFRAFLSGRGVATNYVSSTDDEAFILSFGLQYDSAVGLGSIAPFPQAAPSPAVGWTNVPTSHSPPMQMRLRVLDFGIDNPTATFIFDLSAATRYAPPVYPVYPPGGALCYQSVGVATKALPFPRLTSSLAMSKDL